MNTTNTLSAIERCNVLNWGMFDSESSRKYKEDEQQARKARRKVVQDLSSELPADDAVEVATQTNEAITRLNQALGSIFANVPMPKEEPPKAQEPEAAKPTTVRGETLSTALQIVTGKGKEEMPLAVAYDHVHRMLVEQRNMSKNARRGLSAAEGSQISEFGVLGKIMSQSARQAYAEAMDIANCNEDRDAMISLRNNIIVSYGDFLELNK